MNQSVNIRFCEGPNRGGIWDIALDEAILHLTREAQGPLTMRAWESSSPVLVLPRSSLPKEEKLIGSCLSEGIQMTRGCSGRRLLLYGPGVLSFSFINKSTVETSGCVEREVTELIFPLLKTIQNELSVGEVCSDNDYVHVNDSVVGAFNTSYYFDYLLLQGAILVHSDPNLSGFMPSRNGKKFTSLDTMQPNVSHNRLKESFIRLASQHFHLQIQYEEASTHEIELATDLQRWKYTDEDWMLHGIAPNTLGKILLEAYLAYPPTTRCREIMRMIDDISKKYADKVECRIWFRGRGLRSWLKGVPPGLHPSKGVVQASKKYIVPAIVIEGQITHERTVPIYDDICSRIDKAHRETFGEVLS